MSSIAYAKRNAYKPIDFFYRGVFDVKTNKVAFVDAFQILNDRYVGRMNVCNYFFIAENSVRINELNVIALDELKNYHLVMRENFLIPEKLVYSLPLTVRFLESAEDFSVLVSALKENGYKKGSLVLGFNTNTIIRIDGEGKKRYDTLRRMGFKTSIYGFGEEFNSLDIFSKLNFDYLRLEATYFDSTPVKKRILNMLISYCRANKIGLIMEGVDTPPQMARFKKAGVKMMTGKAVSKLARFVTNEFLGLPDLTGTKKESYLKKLNADLDEEEKRSREYFEKLRLAAIEKAKAEAEEGGIAPASARPELAKSPYQVRLELQKQAAMRAAQAQEEKTAADQYYEETAEEEYSDEVETADGEVKGEVQAKPKKPRKQPEYDAKMDERLMKEAERAFMFEGEMQGMLAVSAVTDEKERARLGNLDVPNKTAEDKAKEKARKDAKKAEEERKAEEEKRLAEERKAARAQKKIVADYAREKRLLGELKGDRLGASLGQDSAFGGFGVTLTFGKKDEEDEYVGHYNADGKWVDEEGFVYNGYFDEDSNWVDYEEFDPTKVDGHYNAEGKYVDADGKEYNGYFDEQGRWIDFTYLDKDGKEVDNGYFDEKIGKWIPNGYFDESGKWHPYS